MSGQKRGFVRLSVFCRLSPLSFLALVFALSITPGIAGCGGGASTSGGSGSGSGGSGGGSTTPTPAVSSISPTSVPAGSTAQTLTVTGSGFLSTSVVAVSGVSESTTFVSASQLTAAVPASQLVSGTELTVVVMNGTLSSGTGSPISLEVDNPSPVILSLSPTAELLGTNSLSLTVTGTGFVPTTAIDVNGAARTTTFTSATQVSVALTAADVAATGSLSLTAVNGKPGGGTSASAALTVDNPPVGSIQLSPSVLTVGSTAQETVTVTGGTFVPNSVVQVNGSARATTYVNPATLTFVATIADQSVTGQLAVTVSNPPPGGGASPIAVLTIAPPSQTPVLTSVTPSSIVAGSPDTTIIIDGTGLVTGSTVQWNGTNLPTSPYFAGSLTAVVPASDLATAGTASVTVSSPTANPSLSNALSINITTPPAPTLAQIYPGGGPIDTATAITLSGTGFTPLTAVEVNGATIPSVFVGSTQITCTIPASSVATPGNVNITVTTPAPGGGTSSPLVFTAFVAITNNDIVYNPTDGLLYASVPVSGVGSGGNSVVGIDPVTGNVMRQIQVGSNPNKLALSTDGTQLFVGLDGAASVAQVNLTTGTVVNQFFLGGGQGIYNPPSTASYLAAVPGSPNSVAVATTGGLGNGAAVSIFDSGVARPNTSTTAGEGPLSFGSSSSTLYLANGSTIEQLTVGSTGITASANLASLSGQVTSIQYDNGRLYLSTGQVLNASAGALLGTFYSSGNTPASGPIVSDSALGRAFVGVTNYSNAGQVFSFDEGTFNQLSSIPVNGVGTQGYPTNFAKIVRWGQTGLALGAQFSAFSSTNELFIFQGPLVKDISSSPADLSVALTAPAAATTGTPISFVASVNNQGPNPAENATLALSLDSSLIVNSITPTQGSCGVGTQFTCDLGNLANGASATVTVSATPTTAATIAGTAMVSSTSDDPTATNDQATTSTTVTGSFYGAVPSISVISPNLVQAGSGDFTLTVNGAGFSADSVVSLGATALTTTYVGPTQLTATVPAAQIASYGWGAITVTNPTPGGGASQVVPLTIYDLVNVPANSILFDPYSQQIYATIPSTATSLTGNSVVTINPLTGAVGTPVLVGSQPTVMTETSDGNYLYIGLEGADSLAQFNLQSQSLTATIPVSFTQYSTTSGVAPTSLAAMPGSDTTLAIGGVTSGWGQFGIFDISGNTGTFRSNLSGIYDGVNPVFADASHVYAFDSQTSGAEFYRYSVNANGLTEIDGTTLDGMGGFQGAIQLAGGLVYGGGGGIANPSTTPPSQVATLPLVDFYESGSNGYGVALAPDPSLQREFLMLENIAGTSAYGLVRYNLTTYTPEALLDMPQSLSTTEAGWTMCRWGQDGLALLSSAQSFVQNPPTVEVMLLRGPFVAPQELQTDSAASLFSSSAGTIAHGTGNTMLTLTGSNFLPGVAVTWNGGYRTTTIVDATHVSVAIPASDLASGGTASLVATNPGAQSSNALQITIN